MVDKLNPRNKEGPLSNVDEWDDEVRRRYPTQRAAENPFRATDPDKKPNAFRNYEAEARACVKEFYRQNHTHQTLEFNRAKRAEYLPLCHTEMGVWQAIDRLSEIVDDSDPDTDLPQIDHALQTAEAIRRDGHPRWFILTGLIHDLGKTLCLFGEPQWAVVGDTFPVGCGFSHKIVFSKFFAENPDSEVPEYQTPTGIYEEGCGMDKLLISWGHDEYLYHVVKDHMPAEGAYIIRYHSFYPWHREGAYTQFMNDYDRRMLRWVKKFNPYDLYTKSGERPDTKQVLPFYKDLVAEFFPDKLAW